MTHRRTVWTFLLVVLMFAVGPLLYAQVAGVPPPPPGDGSQSGAGTGAVAIGQQGLASVLLSFYVPRMMEWLKFSRFPLLQIGARKLNRLVAVGVSTLQGAGLTWVYHAGTAGSGWTFALGSVHSTFTEFIGAALMAFAAQQFFYEHLPSSITDRLAAAFRTQQAAAPAAGG